MQQYPVYVVEVSADASTLDWLSEWVSYSNGNFLHANVSELLPGQLGLSWSFSTNSTLDGGDTITSNAVHTDGAPVASEGTVLPCDGVAWRATVLSVLCCTVLRVRPDRESGSAVRAAVRAGASGEDLQPRGHREALRHPCDDSQ